MVEPLSNQERTLLVGLSEDENEERDAAYVRRARILLLWDQGLTSSEIAPRVGLSARQVRRWLQGFREQRLGIFPDITLKGQTPEQPIPAVAATAARAGQQAIGPAALESTPSGDGRRSKDFPLPGSTEVTVAELCQRYEVDMTHARHVANLALALFEATMEEHGLSDGRRDLVEKAALLHDIGYTYYPERHAAAGRDIILRHRVADMTPDEQRIAAFVAAMHRKRIKGKRIRKALTRTEVPESEEADALAISALVRMADGLDNSRGHSTSLDAPVIIRPDEDVTERGVSILCPVIGRFAHEDAARAQRQSDLWERAMDASLRFVPQDRMALAVELERARAHAEWPVLLDHPGVRPKDRMSEAGRKVLLFHFSRMLEHEAGTRLGEEIEELHDMRVATRRMRLAFQLFTPYFDDDALRPFRKDLRRMARVLGRVRDLDVLLARTEDYSRQHAGSQELEMEPLLASWRRQRAKARDTMLDHLDGKRYARFVRRFGEFLTTPGSGVAHVAPDEPTPRQVYQVVPTLIYSRYETVRGYEALIGSASLDQLHALRIDIKRFHYTLEFFREVLGPEVEPVIDELVALQDHLGDLNDADVACDVLIDFLRSWSQEAHRERINISGATHFLLAKQNDLHRLVEAFPEAWQRFNRTQIRRQLALAVSAL
jgi:CHAD domain-containing protein/transposase-like protein